MMFSRCCSIAKIGTFSVTVIGVTLVLTGWAALAGIAQAEVTDPEDVEEVINRVKVVPQVIGGNLKVDKTNQCNKEGHEGCLLFERDTEGYIVFHVPGSKKKNKSCPEAKYVITKIEVTATADGESSGGSKGDFAAPFPLTGWLESAFPDVNPHTGIIHEAYWNVARSQEWVTNLNDHEKLIDGSYVTKSFWYRITVTACAENDEGTHTTWVSDPRGDNEGKN